MKKSLLCSFLMCSSLASWSLMAANLEPTVTDGRSYSMVERGRNLALVDGGQSAEDVIDGTFSKQSTPCAPFCVDPLNIAEAVGTVGELEVIEFVETSLRTGEGVMIDARTSDRYSKGTIPGSINIPFTVFEKSGDDPYLVAVLEQLGARHRHDVNMFVRSLEKLGFFNGKHKTDAWDFSNARELLIWCSSPWCSQSPRAIRALVNLGYPAGKLHYYRGGMRVWQSLGLATEVPTDTSAYASK